jgi:hypothetical protein
MAVLLAVSPVFAAPNAKFNAPPKPSIRDAIGMWCSVFEEGADSGPRLDGKVKLLVTEVTPKSFSGLHYWEGKNPYGSKVEGEVSFIEEQNMDVLRYKSRANTQYALFFDGTSLDGVGIILKVGEPQTYFSIKLTKESCAK